MTGNGEVKVRELPPDEFGRLIGVGPAGAELFPNALTRVIVAEDSEGKIVAYWWVWPAVHVEPVWISEENRWRAGMVRSLWTQVRNVLVESNIPVAFGIIGYEDALMSLPPALRLGFKKVPGDLYYIAVQPGEKEEMVGP